MTCSNVTEKAGSAVKIAVQMKTANDRRVVLLNIMFSLSGLWVF
jgi:hypothetical protein